MYRIIFEQEKIKMSENRKELIDDVLKSINGGVLTENSFESIDEFVKNARNLDWTKDDVKGLITKIFTSGDSSALSTDGSQKDLQDILDYFDRTY